MCPSLLGSTVRSSSSSNVSDCAPTPHTHIKGTIDQYLESLLVVSLASMLLLPHPVHGTIPHKRLSVLQVEICMTTPVYAFRLSFCPSQWLRMNALSSPSISQAPQRLEGLCVELLFASPHPKATQPDGRGVSGNPTSNDV